MTTAGSASTATASSVDTGGVLVALAVPAGFGQLQIVLVDSGGKARVELTRGHPTPSEFGTFSWSPAGAQLAYGSEGVVGGDLYAVSADGAIVKRLTTGGGNSSPAWSPDGKRLAYVHTVRREQSNGLYQVDADIWLVGADGQDAHPVTADGGEKYAPSWSPDGQKILYAGVGAGGASLFVVDADTGRILLHTADSGGAWSPDGSQIAVEAAHGVDVIAADGSSRRTVAALGGSPVWSPDGARIAFTRDHCTPGIKGVCGQHLDSVFVVGTDGHDERRLTGPIGGGPGSTLDGYPNDDSVAPAWWPDGSRLLFQRQGRVFELNADGTCEHPFAPGNVALAPPAWRPGSTPTSGAIRCVDLRVRAAIERTHVAVVIENGGDETATGLKLTLRVVSGKARLGRPSRLATLAAGASTTLSVPIRGSARDLRVQARVSSLEVDSDPSTTVVLATGS